MCDKSFERGVSKKILDEIFLDFSNAAKGCDIEAMNRLHEEWLMFFKGEDVGYQFVYAKVLNREVILPDKIKKLIKHDATYKYILKSSESIYIVESDSDMDYIETAINEAEGKNIDEKEIYIEDIIAIDDTAQKVFKWDKEDIAIVYVISNVLRIDKFVHNDIDSYTVI